MEMVDVDWHCCYRAVRCVQWARTSRQSICRVQLGAVACLHDRSYSLPWTVHRFSLEHTGLIANFGRPMAESDAGLDEMIEATRSESH